MEGTSYTLSSIWPCRFQCNLVTPRLLVALQYVARERLARLRFAKVSDELWCRQCLSAWTEFRELQHEKWRNTLRADGHARCAYQPSLRISERTTGVDVDVVDRLDVLKNLGNMFCYETGCTCVRRGSSLES